MSKKMKKTRHGEEMKIIFHEKIRDEKKFDSVDALITQINNDISSITRLT